MRVWIKRLATPAAIVAGAIALRVAAGVGFVNYDTLYGLAWGGQLSRGALPAYGVAIAPTPHPLVEILGVVLAPLGPAGVVHVTVALAFLALSACVWVVYALGAHWFGRAAGALGALLLITRVPVLSYGVRAYVDIPYLLLVLSALLVESRRRSGIDGTPDRPAPAWPVLALLALAGLLRPEAWAFSGLYWVYLILWPGWRERIAAHERAPAWLGRNVAKQEPGAVGTGSPGPQAIADGSPLPDVAREPERSRRQLAGLTLLAAAAPLVWVLSDLAITGDALWSLTNTRHTAQALDRVTGIANVPEYIPRRIGEILRPPVLVGAALGGVLSLLWLGSRARLGALVGVVAVAVFAVFAAAGLPINTRYAFVAAAILCVFCGAGVFGWTLLASGDPRRRWWMVGGLIVALALVAYAPSQYRGAHNQLQALARQQRIEGDLLALVHSHAIELRCGPVGVPNHAPIPLLALYLKTSPKNVISAQVNQISYGTYVDPASMEVEHDYVLDPRDPHLAVSVPPGFTESATGRSWLIFTRCS
ncbi:MAG TPA: hypothetical protein VGH60_01840 [Solirubrobacteraceae bacterium]